ncbi:ABC transporter ATP-binding protein [Bacillus solimangrovi]|uniref:Iron-dicitrate transporter ATP-binding subunit n=1 Tax=Bacillus solimangrovi TaxID=1305675 RepID=A0A1E5LCE4_9BACI|nr:ABC transporter ATP-binding protein [Bacillus solimangrovi]OEH91752.1 iron-dicitrate transporter ATP-binding subunit [Bacillus solimangrovi]
MVKLSAEHLSLGYDLVSVVDDLTLTIPEGKITILIGGNGCGKSTILRALARLLKPKVGTVYLDGKEIERIHTKEVAKKLAILPQGPQAPDGLTVKELCYYGRHPHKGLLSKETKQDHEIVEWALDATRMHEFAERPLDALSGGQRQRAWIAMALCQGTDLLLLDEPTTYLDLAHQIEVLELLKELNSLHGRTIVMVLHDLNQAARYADYLISISSGQIYKEGLPEDVFTEEMIHNVFGLESCIIQDPVAGSPMCVPIGISKRKNSHKTISVS